MPPGNQPTLSQYIGWAQTEGCVITHGVDSQTSIPIIRIESPRGYAFVPGGIRLGEILTPTTVGYLDRRLGLISPWFGLPLDS